MAGLGTARPSEIEIPNSFGGFRPAGGGSGRGNLNLGTEIEIGRIELPQANRNWPGAVMFSPTEFFLYAEKYCPPGAGGVSSSAPVVRASGNQGAHIGAPLREAVIDSGYTVGAAHPGRPHSGSSPHMGKRGNDDWAAEGGGPYMFTDSGEYPPVGAGALTRPQTIPRREAQGPPLRENWGVFIFVVESIVRALRPAGVRAERCIPGSCSDAVLHDPNHQSDKSP